MFIFFIIALCTAKVIDVETLVQLERLSLGCEFNGVVYYTASKWFEEENKTKYGLFRTTIDATAETAPVEIIPYGSESFSNFICSDKVYLLHNGQIATLENDVITDISESPISIDTFKIRNINGVLKGLCSMTVFPSMTLEESVAQFEKLEKQNYRVYDSLMIRRWDTYWDGQFQHLFTFSANANEKITNFNDIMNDLKYDCPARPFGGNEEYDLSPDGTTIAFSILMENVASSLNNNIHIAKFDTPTQWTCITENNNGYDNQPQFNNDGSLLYYLSMVAPKDESDRSVVMSFDLTQQTVKNITGEIDLSFTAPYIIKDNYVHICTCIEGNNVVVGIDAAATSLSREDVNVLTPNGTNGAFQLLSNGFIFEYNNFTLPNELFYYSTETKETKQFTFINKKVLDEIEFGEVSEMRFTGANDDTVHAFIIYPPNMDKSKKYPTILYTHGGPESPWSNNFHYRWNPEVIAAQGYIVFAPNIHGSGSYGDAFMKAIRSNWGGWPYEDLMAGVKALGEQNPNADTNNMCAMGASYGGYMMNWLNSQSGNLLKCIICHDGIIDAEGSYYYMDEMYFLEVEFGHPYYENNTFYKKYSPMNFINGYQTPQLTIHGGTDFRIDVVAGYQQFVTLQRKGIESKLVVYPEENHWVLRPHNSIDWHQQVFDWLGTYLTPAVDM